MLATDGGIEPDETLRQLEFMKSNYGPIAATTTLRWKDHVFVLEPKPGSLEKLASDAKAETVFLELLRRFTKEGRTVGDKTGHSYAPAQFAKEPEAKNAGLLKEALANAMRRLFAQNKIHTRVMDADGREMDRPHGGGLTATRPCGFDGRPYVSTPPACHARAGLAALRAGPCYGSPVILVSAAGELAQDVADRGFLARLVSKHQPPGMQRRRVDVDGVAVIIIPDRHAVQHDRPLNWLALLIERHLLGKLGRLDLAERERAAAQILDGAAHDLVARQRSVDAPFATDEVEIFCQCALTHRHRLLDIQ